MNRNLKKYGKKLAYGFLVLSLVGGELTTANYKIVQAEENSIGNVQETIDTGVEQTELEEKSVTDIREYDNNELLVVYKDEIKENKELPEGAIEETITEDSSLVETENKSDLKEAIETLSQDSDVAYVQPNYTYHALTSVTNDTYSNYQWAYNDANYNIGITTAWNMGAGANKNVIVAVTDTGIDYNHVDLKDKIWTNSNEIAGNGKDDDGNGFVDDIYGWNFASGNNRICEYKLLKGEYVDNHGTHVAGIINATAENQMGIAGVASKSNVQLMSVKIFGDDGTTTTAGLIKGIRYAEENGAEICNMSLGGDATNTYMDKLLYNTMSSSNMLFICAAGNGTEATKGVGFDITNHRQAPASFNLENMICVGNMNKNGIMDESSCYSSTQVDIAAPGTEILSTGVDARKSKRGVYVSMTGTSMATPMVTGVAAMLQSYYGILKPSQIKEAILGGAKINEKLNNKVAENRMLSADGAMKYWQEHAFINTSVNNIRKSNYKEVSVKVTNYNGIVDKVYYAFGTQEESYFENGTMGTEIKLVNGRGSFTAEKSGTYTLYVVDRNGFKSMAQVNVTIPTVKTVRLSATTKTLKKGKTYILRATVNPSDVYVTKSYKTSNKSVATVSSSGKITAKKKGKAKITVNISDGTRTKSVSCVVSVT
ncbi:S8 family serine peptidase [Velocimicrobium porci]|uniref:S8 family serine peptidase n=1 Tax=Velocimicrobium porci TaxID=2606634 RepID=A0A6L5XXC2_9FIRM|nr:S8 family serine peptidase [Velocimicrobium porci]MSS63506.1 S8 family serine peptidase [Velocimicrobium porci]